jgi:hypothetical protein
MEDESIIKITASMKTMNSAGVEVENSVIRMGYKDEEHEGSGMNGEEREERRKYENEERKRQKIE